MIQFLKNYRPSLPPVALLIESPSVLALRVTRTGRDLQPLVRHEEGMTALVEAMGAPGEGATRLADAALTRLGRPKRLCAVLGDPFFRMQVLTLNDFPRGEEERLQIILWHLRKTVNVPVESLRLRYDILQRTPGTVTLWLSFCQEEAVVAFEKAFEDCGCEVGYVGASTAELHNLSLARGLYPEEGSALLLNRTQTYLSFLFTEGGRPVFFRCKELAPDEESDGDGSRIEQELRLTLAYHKDKLGGGRLAKVLVRSHPAHLALPLESVLDADVPVEEMAAATGLAETWGPAWLPLVALLGGA